MTTTNQPTTHDEVETEAVTVKEADDKDLNEEMDEKYGRRSGKHNLRARRRRDHSHLHANHATSEEADAKIRDYIHLHTELHCENGPSSNEMGDAITHTALSQYGVNKGLKMFGQDGSDAMLKELK
jgi:hypothetical protein